MFSFFCYACSLFRDDTSSALLHPEREEMQRERERERDKEAGRRRAERYSKCSHLEK